MTYSENIFCWGSFGSLPPTAKLQHRVELEPLLCLDANYHPAIPLGATFDNPGCNVLCSLYLWGVLLVGWLPPTSFGAVGKPGRSYTLQVVKLPLNYVLTGKMLN